MKVSEVRDLIKQKIEAGEYMKDPLVSIEFLNFKYTVLGAVGSNGTYTVDGDRVTLLEAIAKAGDLTSKAKVDRVAVIREIEANVRFLCTTCEPRTYLILPVFTFSRMTLYM